MKKIILSVLVMTSLMLMIVGSVSAQAFTNVPTTDISGDFLVEWENTAGIPGIYLQYGEGTCVSSPTIWEYIDGPMDISQLSSPWDTTSVVDGEYCLRLQDGTTHDEMDVTVDNTEPIITTFTVTVPGEEGLVKTEVFVYASDNIGVDYCVIAWGDGDTKDCSADTSKTYKHQYGDNGPYTVTLTVKDEAGHEVSDTITANPDNIDPTITANITAPDNSDADDDDLVEAAVGEAVLFEATANDVEADLEAGLTCKWKFDGSNQESTTANKNGVCKVYHTWTSASKHTVDLTIKDKDGGSVDAIQFELEVEETEHMTPMQQVVADNVFGFELDEQWAVNKPKRFKTSFSSLSDCEEVIVPGMGSGDSDEMEVEDIIGTSKCKVTWTPSNNQRGDHRVIIKAISGTDFKYYSFDVTVYSWGIELVSGWNLISIPYMPTSSDIDDVFADIIDNVAYEDTSTATVFRYDAVERVWYRARTTSTHSKFDYVKNHKDEELASIVPGYAYWIKMENEDWIYGVEKNFPVNTAPGANGIDLATESWNLIGRFGVDSASSPWKIALESLRKPFYMDNYVNPKLGIYKLISVTASGDTVWDQSDTINLAKGYWVRTAAGSEGRTTVIYEPDSI